MEKLTFLVIIGVIALVLVSWLIRVEQRRSQKAKKQKGRKHGSAHEHYRHAATARHGLPNRNTSLPPRHVGAFEMRHQRAGEEMRHGSAITADRIYSDKEADEDGSSNGLEMSAVKYVPEEDRPRGSQSKASQPRR